MMFNKKFLFLTPVLLFTLISCGDGSQKQTKAPEVEAIKAAPQNVPLSSEYPARAKGYKETEVRARVGGILLKRNYVEGSEVKEGDILFQIDPEPYKAALAQAKGQLDDNNAQLKAAQTQWHRIAELFKERIVSEKSRDDAKANLDSLKAGVEMAEAELKTAELNLGYTTVTAPISGITSLETQSEGSLIVANSDESLLTTITQLDPIYIMFSISDNDMFRFQTMLNENIIDHPDFANTVKAKVKFNDDTVYEKEGEINFVNPSIDESTGTVQLRAVFPNPDRKIMPKQFVRVTVEGLVMKNAITVPKEAVLQGAQGSFVYKVNQQGKVEVALVTIGLTAKDGTWIIEKGLKAGDIIITNGIMKLKEGMQVTPVFKTDKPAESQTHKPKT